MKTNGEFIFKTIEEREGGEFVNDRGQKIKYDGKYVIKLDEKSEDGKINDRRFSIDKKDTELINQFKSLPTYSDVKIEFDVRIFNSQVRLVPVKLLEL